jgi:DNA repair exonuclease SbcCD ATPase subunit
MSNNRSWLGIAEYVSIAGSVLGSAAALVSQQAIYGLAPVSISLVLNLINRRRLEQLIQQRTPASAEVEHLKNAIASFRMSNSQVKQDSQSLVLREELTSIASVIQELNERQNGLRLSLVPLQSQLDDLSQEFNKRPELEQIESLAVVITALKQCIDGLPQPELLQQHSAELQQQVDSALGQLSKNAERIAGLEQAIAQLQHQRSQQ